MIAYFLIFLIVGICFGSFSTVLITRWKNNTSGILLGRSECPHCHHTLRWYELIPIISYIIQGRKCKNCHTTIPYFYPLAEGVMGLIFLAWGVSTYIFGIWYTDISFWILGIWSFITGVYTLYDIRYMEIPDQVLVPGIYGTLVLLLITFFGENGIFFDIGTHVSNISLVQDHIYAALILYTFFYLQILIPGGLYLIKKRKFTGLGELIISYFTFIFTLPLSYCIQENDTNEEIPTWIGGGDLRVALFIGLTLGTIHGLSSLVFGYILGSIVGIFILISQRKLGKEKRREIAFGPFLGAGWILSLLFYRDILNYFIQ